MVPLNLLVIRTKQPKELADFYQMLGLVFDYHRHGKGVWHYATKLNNLVFEIYPLTKNQKVADQSLRLGFSVNDLDGLVKELQAKGVTILQPPQITEWGNIAIINDLDGRKIELKENS